MGKEGENICCCERDAVLINISLDSTENYWVVANVSPSQSRPIEINNLLGSITSNGPALSKS